MQNIYMHQILTEIDKDPRTPEEIYANIVSRIKTISKDTLTDQEACVAARNLIGFCQEIINCKMKKAKSIEKVRYGA